MLEEDGLVGVEVVWVMTCHLGQKIRTNLETISSIIFDPVPITVSVTFSI